MKRPLQAPEILKNPGVWILFLLFICSFCLFASLFYLESLAKVKISTYTRDLVKKGFVIEGLKMEKFPPGLEVKRILAPAGEKKLAITGLSLKPGLFPPRLDLECRTLGGAVKAVIHPHSLFSPLPEDIIFGGENISLVSLFELAPEQAGLLVAEEGAIHFEGQFKAAFSGTRLNRAKCIGELKATLRNGSLKSNLPMLKLKRLADISGEARLKLDGAKCLVERFDVRSGTLSLRVNGDFAPWYSPESAVLNLDTELNIPPGDLEEELMPPRTMALIRKNGMVRAHIEGTVVKPRLKLEE